VRIPVFGLVAASLTLTPFVASAQAPPAGQPAANTSNAGCTFAGTRGSSNPRTSGGGPYFAFTFDTGGSVAPDGRGAYVHQSDGVHTWMQNSGIRLYVYGSNEVHDSAEPTDASRRLRIDLSRPLDARSPNLGIRDVGRWVVHWKQDNQKRVIHGLLDIPVGTESDVERMEIHVPIDGKVYMLRLGSMDISVCWLENPVPADGTTAPRVRRVSEDEWTVEMPHGSRARLSERTGRLPDVMSIRFENLGLYEISGRFTIRTVQVP
jgi:hypothetical protein